MRKVLFCSILVTLFLTGCVSVFENKVRGNGDVTIEQRAVSSFDKINIGGVFKVYLTQGDTEQVEVEIDSNLQQYVNVYHKGNVLYLNIEKGVNWGKTTKNNVYITLKNIDQLSIEGVCAVETHTILNLENLKLDVEGVSNSSLELYCNQLDVEMSGVGNIELAGETHTLTVKKDGVGKLDASDLIAAIVNIRNSGVGSAYIYASQELSMTNSGVGSIYYSGDAVIKLMKSDGVGKIQKK